MKQYRVKYMTERIDEIEIVRESKSTIWFIDPHTKLLDREKKNGIRSGVWFRSRDEAVRHITGDLQDRIDYYKIEIQKIELKLRLKQWNQ